MSILEKLSLKYWWNIILLFGIFSIFSSFYFKIDFIDNKNLFGLGIGLIIFSLSFIIANKQFSEIKPANAYTGPTALISWEKLEHNIFTIILLVLGLLIKSYFFIKILIFIM